MKTTLAFGAASDSDDQSEGNVVVAASESGTSRSLRDTVRASDGEHDGDGGVMTVRRSARLRALQRRHYNSDSKRRRQLARHNPQRAALEALADTYRDAPQRVWQCAASRAIEVNGLLLAAALGEQSLTQRYESDESGDDDESESDDESDDAQRQRKQRRRTKRNDYYYY